jgi:hypothetical protein
MNVLLLFLCLPARMLLPSRKVRIAPLRWLSTPRYDVIHITKYHYPCLKQIGGQLAYHCHLRDCALCCMRLFPLPQRQIWQERQS